MQPLPIFVSGKKSSMPHGRPSHKAIEPGDFVTIDMGAVVNGYMSDMTRTFAVGHATDEMRAVYATVLEAQAAGLAAFAEGMRGCDVDKAARDVIKAAGYGASVKGAQQSAGPAAGADALADHETPKLRRRLFWSLGFLLVLMYFSMGHMMWGWPLPKFYDGNHVAMGLTQLLLTVIIMVINQKFFISGFQALWHRAPNMDTLVALGATAAFVYSTYALFAMTGAQVRGDEQAVMNYMMDFYFESAAMILTLITVGKTLEARSKGKTTDALRSLMELAPKTATVCLLYTSDAADEL